MHLDPIENQIKELLQVIPNDAKRDGWEWKRGDWTKRIKRDLCNLGRQLDYFVTCNGYEQCQDPEWLYDMVWVKHKENYASCFPLVLECEWTPNIPVDDDFLKLMLARADHHVYIFEADSDEKIDLVVNGCIDHLKHFESLPSGDRFLFAGVNWNPREFRFHLYVQP